MEQRNLHVGPEILCIRRQYDSWLAPEETGVWVRLIWNTRCLCATMAILRSNIPKEAFDRKVDEHLMVKT